MSPRLFFLVLSVLSCAFISSLQAAERFVRSQLLMGNVTVTLTVDDKKSHRELAFSAMEKAFEAARHLESLLSEWRPESQTTRLNQNAGKPPIPIDRELMALLEESQKISEMTDGAFDITFASKNKHRTYRDVILKPETGLATLRAGVKIGVSSILKGLIVDRMSDVLRRAGFRKFLVNAGDIYASGTWRIGLRNPDAPDTKDSLCEITVRNRAVSTSGQYERGDHIIDPKTGKPAFGLKSVTVIAGESEEASPLATGFFVLGKTRAQKVLEAHPEISAIFVVNPRDTARCRPF